MPHYNQSKSTHSTVASRTRLANIILMVVLALLLPLAALAETEIVLSTGNDDFSGNSRSDDLYSAGLGVSFEFSRNRGPDVAPWQRFVSIQENLFTDRDAGVRFDETWFIIGQHVERNNWSLAFYAGTVRAGRGLFGERGQNAVHRLIGDNEVTVDYVEGTEHFPTAGVSFRRFLFANQHVVLETAGDVRTADGFQHWATVSLDAGFKLSRWLDMSASVGVRASSAQYAPIRPWVHGVAKTLEASFTAFDRIQLTWSNNEYGTRMNHVSLSFKLPSRGLRAKRQPHRPEWHSERALQSP